MEEDTTLAGGRKQVGGEPSAARRTRPTRAPRTFGGYPRVSRQGAREDERLRSPQFQRELIEAKAKAEGVAVKMFPAEIDKSGAKVTRAILDDVVSAIERGELAGIIVAKLDRLSRLPPKQRIELVDRIERAGGVILSASESFDSTTPEGRFQRNLWFELARLEWEKKAEGFDIAKRNAVENGIAIKSLAPFALRFTDAHGLEPVADEAPVVRELFRRRFEGASYGELLAYFERATGRQSYRQTIKYMLSNRAYVGELRYGGGVAEDGTPQPLYVKRGGDWAIVDEELFEAVQRVNGARAADRSGTGSGRAKAMLASIAKCAGCGRGLVRTRTGSRQTYSYKCPQDTRHCSARAHVQAAELETYVVELVLAWAGPAADAAVELELEDAAGDRELAERLLGEAERRLEAWAADIELEERDEAAYRAGLEARRARVELRRQELEALGEASELEIARGTLREALTSDDYSADERRRLLAIALDSVVVARAGGRRVPVAERAALVWRAGAGPTPVLVPEHGAELLEEPGNYRVRAAAH